MFAACKLLVSRESVGWATDVLPSVYQHLHKIHYDWVRRCLRNGSVDSYGWGTSIVTASVDSYGGGTLI